MNPQTPVRARNTEKMKSPTKNKSYFTPNKFSRRANPTHNVSDPSGVTKSSKALTDTSFPPLTPRSNGMEIAPLQTPECYNSVTLETPRRESSREKNVNGKISKLDVAVRVRPMNARELNTVGSSKAISVKDNDLIVQASVAGDSTSELKHRFQYDYILWSCDSANDFADQSKVYQVVARPLLDVAFEGYNACLFAYGQTGSGKSYSMMGTDTESIGTSINIQVDAGIIPRFCQDLFTRLETLEDSLTATVEVSYFEIYNEKIHDLLSSSLDGVTRSTPLKVREHPVWGPYVVDLSVHPVNSFAALNSWIVAGNKQRATASTAMNDKSSRSHSIFSVVLSLSAPKEREDIISRRSKVSLVDLAGSERLGNSVNNEERLKQGVSINRSLLTLGKVIAALSEQRRNVLHVPYRESVLTWLLRESLGGNSRTCMLATITAASCHVDETLSTLRYAAKARNIVNRVRINEDPQDRLIRELRQEVERLRALRQEYQRSSLNSSLNSTLNNTRLSTSANDTQCSSTQCIIENINGKLHVEVNDLKNNSCIIDDTIVFKNGDKLVIDGGSSFTIEKREVISDESDDSLDEENDRNLPNTNNTLNIDVLNSSIAAIERYYSEVEVKSKVCSTPDSPNDLSPYRSNFLEELEKVLSVFQSPVRLCNSPKIKAVVNSSSQKKSARKADKEAVDQHVKHMQDISKSIAIIAKDNESVVEALRYLDNAIQTVQCAFSIRKQHKSVTFLSDNNV